MFIHRLFAPVLIAASICGCASQGKHLSAVASYDRGQPEEAIVFFQDAAKSRKSEPEILRSETAICRLMNGETRVAEQDLHEVRQRLDYLKQKDITEQTASLLTDEKAVAWTGREFERRMLDCLLMLSSLAGDRQDAFAFASRTGEQLRTDWADVQPQQSTSMVVAEDSAESGSHLGYQTTVVTPVGHSTEPSALPPASLMTNALAAYLIAAVHSELPMNGDAVVEARQQMAYWKADTPVDLRDAKFGVHTPADHGTLHVITLVGRITDWQPESVQPTSAALLLADQILSAAGDHTLPPTIAPVRIGRPKKQRSRHPFATAIRISDSTRSWHAAGHTFVDLNRVANESYQASRDQVVAKAVARRIVKKGVVYAAKDQLDIDKDSGTDLLLSLGGAAWEALEKPDLRHLELLPERIDVAVLSLPVGRYRMDAGASSKEGDLIEPDQSTSVEIVNGRNTFVICFCPQDRITHTVGGH